MVQASTGTRLCRESRVCVGMCLGTDSSRSLQNAQRIGRLAALRASQSTRNPMSKTQKRSARARARVSQGRMASKRPSSSLPNRTASLPTAALALVTGWFAPESAWNCNLTSRTSTLPSIARSPHPVGGRSFIVSNSACPPTVDADARASWNVIHVPELACADDTSCILASKATKMMLAGPRLADGRVGDLIRRVGAPVEMVMYMDASITMSPPAFQHYLDVARSQPRPFNWSLIIRRHEASTHTHGIMQEVNLAMDQPRYRSSRGSINELIASHPDVPADGDVHNTGLLLWRVTPDVLDQTTRLQATWYNLTRDVTLECQITFYYAARDASVAAGAVVTLPFGQEGVTQWGHQTTDLDTPGWRPTGNAAALEASTRTASSDRRMKPPGWWRRFRSALVLTPEYL